jgi:WD40 repeat protein
MAVEVAVFTPKPPVNLFESARRQVGTTFETLIQPTLYAEVDNLGQVQRLRNTTAVLTAMRLHNSSASARTVDFQVRSSRRVTYQAEVTAVAGENWIRLDRTTRIRGVSVFGWDWTQSPPVRLSETISPLSPIATSCSWRQDSRYLAVCFNAQGMRVYDAQNSYAIVYEEDNTSTSYGAASAIWSSDGRYLAVRYINVVDPSTTPYLRVFDFDDIGGPVEVTLPDLSAVLTESPAHMSWVGRFLAVGRATAAQPVLVLDWNSGSPVYDATLSAALSDDTANLPIRGVAFSPDGARFAVSYFARDRLRVYNISGTTATRINDPIFAANTQRFSGLPLAWSADSRYLTCLSGPDTSVPFTVYDFDSGVSLRPAPPSLPLLPGLAGAAWSPDGRYLCI